MLLLREVEQRQDRTRLASFGIFGNQRLGADEVLRRELKARRLLDVIAAVVTTHRSISPNTTSMDPTIATTSASM